MRTEVGWRRWRRMHTKNINSKDERYKMRYGAYPTVLSKCGMRSSWSADDRWNFFTIVPSVLKESKSSLLVLQRRSCNSNHVYPNCLIYSHFEHNTISCLINHNLTQSDQIK